MFKDRDFVDLIYEQLGRDAAAIVEALYENEAYEEAKALTDCDVYEQTVESNTRCFNDLLDEIDRARIVLSKTRTDKNVLNRILDNLKEQIANQI